MARLRLPLQRPQQLQEDSPVHFVVVPWEVKISQIQISARKCDILNGCFLDSIGSETTLADELLRRFMVDRG